MPIGKASFSEEQLSDNFRTLIEAIMKAMTQHPEGTVFKEHHHHPDHGTWRKAEHSKICVNNIEQEKGYPVKTGYPFFVSICEVLIAQYTQIFEAYS